MSIRVLLAGDERLVRAGFRMILKTELDREVVGEAADGLTRPFGEHVSADEKVEKMWRYLLVSEANVKTAKGSWPALKKLAS